MSGRMPTQVRRSDARNGAAEENVAFAGRNVARSPRRSASSRGYEPRSRTVSRRSRRNAASSSGFAGTSRGFVNQPRRTREQPEALRRPHTMGVLAEWLGLLPCLQGRRPHQADKIPASRVDLPILDACISHNRGSLPIIDVSIPSEMGRLTILTKGRSLAYGVYIPASWADRLSSQVFIPHSRGSYPILRVAGLSSEGTLPYHPGSLEDRRGTKQRRLCGDLTFLPCAATIRRADGRTVDRTIPGFLPASDEPEAVVVRMSPRTFAFRGWESGPRRSDLRFGAAWSKRAMLVREGSWRAG